MPAPPVSGDGVLVRARALGICGTDREIVAGQYGWAPDGLARLITRRVPLNRWREAFTAQPDYIKVVVEFAS
ncbi:MAG: hypothetical protein ACREB8_17630 [Pseudolabrys sp.]